MRKVQGILKQHILERNVLNFSNLLLASIGKCTEIEIGSVFKLSNKLSFMQT